MTKTSDLLVLLFLVCTIAVLTAYAIAQQPATPQWEYYLLRTKDRNWEDRLDSLGVAGWELAAYAPLRVVTDRMAFGIEGGELFGTLILKRQRS